MVPLRDSKGSKCILKLFQIPLPTTDTVSKEIKCAWKKKKSLKSSPEVVALQFKQDFFFPLS